MEGPKSLDGTMSDSDNDSYLSQTTAPSVTGKGPVIVGIYGIPGCGKTFLLDQLKQKLGQQRYAFYEGSKVIASLVPGGLDAFRKLSEREKMPWRQSAIESVRKVCATSGKLGIVTGHFMFWPERENIGQPVYTPHDLEIYTHILYLDVAAGLIAQRRRDDVERNRPEVSIDHLRKWQDAEKTQLRHRCRHHNILFCVLSAQTTLLDRASAFIRDFQYHTERYNLSCAESEMDGFLSDRKNVQTVLVLDGDKTLAAEDTGELFWATATQAEHGIDPLKELFSGPLGHSYTAFRQAVLMYEETADETEFDALCVTVASAVRIHPEFLSLLRLAKKQDHVGALVVTCGLRRVWEKILEMEGLSGTVKVIGGGRITDGFVVTASVKADLVSRLKDVHHLYVVAFGDSPLDLPMLSAANQAIVVVGHESIRSKSMDAALQDAMEENGLQASQVLLPSQVKPRLDVSDLPLIQINGSEFINSVLSSRNEPRVSSRFLHATESNIAKILTTPTRDANINGPNLRKAHRRIGWYLAMEYLPRLVGLAEYTIPHVQGHQTSGFRVHDEQHTLIIALMRGGEPMAFGVNDALPSAMFAHAKEPEDVQEHHLTGKHIVILVDSVVNSGGTVVQFVQRIRKVCSWVRIVVIAGVVQAQSVSEGNLAHILARDASLNIIALRLSHNKFSGTGATDTGNRLFNTTCLP